MTHSIFLRGRYLLFLVCLFLLAPVLRAQPITPPVVLDKQYSADMIITGAGGNVMQQKIFAANGDLRTDQISTGMSILVLPEKQKMYSILHAQKLVMSMPYDPAKMKSRIALANLQGTYTEVGPATINGVVCTEYKYVSTDGKAYNIWVDTVRKIPVQMEALDHSFTLQLKNYQAAPQPAALFEIPPDYQVMEMPAMPNLTPPSAPGP
jgi:outer membrane lipoprotein-sorting protein